MWKRRSVRHHRPRRAASAGRPGEGGRHRRDGAQAGPGRHPETITVSGIPVGKASDARSVMDGNDYVNYDVTSHPDGSEKLTMKPGAIRSLETATLEHSIETIRERVSALGVTEPTVQQYGLGDNEVLVELPGISDPGKVEDAIKSHVEAGRLRGGQRAVRERPGGDDGAEWHRPAGRPAAAWQHLAELSRRGVSAGAGERGGGNGLPRCAALDGPERASEPDLHADHRGGRPLLQVHLRALQGQRIAGLDGDRSGQQGQRGRHRSTRRSATAARSTAASPRTRWTTSR